MLCFFQQIPQQPLTDNQFNAPVLYDIAEIQQEIHTV